MYPSPTPGPQSYPQRLWTTRQDEGSVVIANLEPEAAGRPGGSAGGMGAERAGVRVMVAGEEVVAAAGDPPRRAGGGQLEAGVGEPVGVPVEAPAGGGVAAVVEGVVDKGLHPEVPEPPF